MEAKRWQDRTREEQIFMAEEFERLDQTRFAHFISSCFDQTVLRSDTCQPALDDGLERRTVFMFHSVIGNYF